MKRLILFIPLTIFIWGCSNTSNKLDTLEISDTQRQREVCLDWYGYRVDTTKATKAITNILRSIALFVMTFMRRIDIRLTS